METPDINLTIKARALSVYRKPPGKLNCAQSVLAGAKNRFKVTEKQIEECRSFGGGRSPGGQCGALYAAKTLLSHPHQHMELEAKFQKEAGSTLCREIRKLNLVPCEGCVSLAADFLEQHKEQTHQ